MKSIVGLVFACAISQVAAHGYVSTVRVNGVEYPGWNVNTDPYATPVVRSSPRCVLGCEYLPGCSLCVLSVGRQMTLDSSLIQRLPT